MKAKFGAIVVDGRGKIGGHVFSKNRGGSYMRTKVTPTNPQTIHQAAVRNRLTQFSQGWRGLTQAQRDAWNAAVGNFAKTDVFGDIKQPTGLNLFVKLNSNLDLIGVAAILLPPLPSEVEAVLTISAASAVTGSVFDVAYTPTPVPVGTTFVLEATAQVSPGKNFLKNEFRVLTTIAAASTSPEDIAAAYVARFGSLIEGQKVGVRMYPVNAVTGQKGQALSTTVIIAA